MTEWNEYRALDLKRIKQTLKQPIIVDLRNVYPLELMTDQGFTYYDVGRAPAVEPALQVK